MKWLVGSLAVLRRFVRRRLAALMVRVIIAHAVGGRRIAFRPLCMYGEEALAVAFQVYLQYVRMAFLVGHIVRPLIKCRNGNGAHARCVQVTRRAVRYLTTSSTPTYGASAKDVGR